MGCSRTTALTFKSYRYSIPQLLELSSHINSLFDLSKLSFNAVRAGIVPALGDCVMASRESAVQQRARGCSQQTTDTSDEVIVFQGYRTEHPLRQPYNAPPETSTQKDDGFAHFLKTHSSPNNHRVTAGGRIVPMEKRPAPPRFTLSASNDNSSARSTRKMAVDADCLFSTNNPNCSANRNNGMNSPTKTSTTGCEAPSRASFVPTTVLPEFAPDDTTSLAIQKQALESNIFMQNQLLSYGQALSDGSIYPAVPGMTSQIPVLGQQYSMNLSYPPCGAQFTLINTMSAGLPISLDNDPRALPALQSMLSQSNQTFEIYDQHLKELDKYRATHPRRDDLVRQRVDIAAQRAAVKEEIRRLQAAISLRESPSSFVPTLPHPQWRPINSPGYRVQESNARGQPVPIKEPTQPNNATSKTKLGNSSKLNVAAATYVPRTGVSPTSTAAASLIPQSFSFQSRMPTLPAAHYSRLDSGSPELKAVDAWGERVGAPPEDLLREQRLLAEAMLSELNSPKVSDDDGSDSASAQSVTFAGESVNETTFGHLDLTADRSGRAPASIEADYEKQMDALRKPSGTITQIKLSEGQVQVVQGNDLKPPAPENMSNFERSYWSQKSAYSIRSNHSNTENSRAPSFTAGASILSFEKPVLSQDQAKSYRGELRDSSSRQVLSEQSASTGYGSNAAGASSQQDEWDAALRKLHTEAARQANKSADGHGYGATPVVIGKPKDVVDQEALANKTYSSTAVQNIHVTSSLPRSLDGAVEANLRKINSPGKGSNKAKSPGSPRTIFRSAGDAWFGPFRRKFYDPAIKDDESDVARHEHTY